MFSAVDWPVSGRQLVTIVQFMLFGESPLPWPKTQTEVSLHRVENRLILKEPHMRWNKYYRLICSFKNPDLGKIKYKATAEIKSRYLSFTLIAIMTNIIFHQSLGWPGHTFWLHCQTSQTYQTFNFYQHKSKYIWEMHWFITILYSVTIIIT